MRLGVDPGPRGSPTWSSVGVLCQSRKSSFVFLFKYSTFLFTLSSNALSSPTLYLCPCPPPPLSSLTLFPRTSLNLSRSFPPHSPGSYCRGAHKENTLNNKKCYYSQNFFSNSRSPDFFLAGALSSHVLRNLEK